jgi:hypothetical protein
VRWLHRVLFCSLFGFGVCWSRIVYSGAGKRKGDHGLGGGSVYSGIMGGTVMGYGRGRNAHGGWVLHECLRVWRSFLKG